LRFGKESDWSSSFINFSNILDKKIAADKVAPMEPNSLVHIFL